MPSEGEAALHSRLALYPLQDELLPFPRAHVADELLVVAVEVENSLLAFILQHQALQPSINVALFDAVTAFFDQGFGWVSNGKGVVS